VAHAERLAALFQARDVKAAALTGKMTRRAREATLEAARAGELAVIVGTQLLDEGVDLPRLSRVVLAWPAKAEGRIVQRIGRALRVHEGKAEPLAIDIVDEHVGVLRSQARARRGVFERSFLAGRVAA
jgi:superfamily II DNA or RNA helicase